MICYSEEGLVVWHVEETESELSSLLPSSEQYTDRKGLHRISAMAEAIMVRRVLGEPLLHMPSGRPYIPSGKFAVSLSNSANYAALSYGKERAGVDIELKSRNASRVINRVCTEDELCKACALYPENGAILLWCLKEASFKMVKEQPEGISLDRQILLYGDRSQQTAMMQTPEGLFTLKFREVGDLLVVNG